MTVNEIEKVLLRYAMELFPDFQQLDESHYSIFDDITQKVIEKPG